MPSFFTRIRVAAARGAIAFALASPIACGRAPEHFGQTPEAGRANAAELFGGLSVRFRNAQRVGALDAIHRRLTRDALHPSRLYDDTTLWSGTRGATRIAVVQGAATSAGVYALTQRRGSGAVVAAPPPARPGEVRIVTALTRLSEHEYQWDATTDFALGRAATADIARGLTAGLRELEDTDTAALRARLRRTLPRSSEAFGLAFSLDTMRTSKRGDGATLVTVGIGMHPDRVRSRFPAFGKYLKEYLSPARYHFRLVASDGASFGDLLADDNRIRLRLAVKNGALVPLDAAARPLPDTLTLRSDLFLHVLVFNVGMSELHGRLALMRTANATGFAIQWTREPHWHFPLGTEHLIRTPLRRPFAGEGARMELMIRDGVDGNPTMLTRRLHLVVQESGILRFLARLGKTAADDFNQRVDREANRFVGEAFAALAEDVAAP